MLGFVLVVLVFSGFLEIPIANSSNPPSSTRFQDSSPDSDSVSKSKQDPFWDLFSAFRKWDSQVGCAQFREKYGKNGSFSSSSSLQDVDGKAECSALKMDHVSVLVKGWTWIPDNLDNLYSCRCGLSCLWTKSSVLADKPDALLFETTTPPFQVLPPLNLIHQSLLSLTFVSFCFSFCITLIFCYCLYCTCMTLLHLFFEHSWLPKNEGLPDG